MNFSRVQILSLIFLALVSCAPMGTHRAREVNQLMPLIGGSFSALKKQVENEKWDPLPSETLDRMELLFEELKTSDIDFYTKDAASWTRYCNESQKALHELKTAWERKDIPGVKASLSYLAKVRDAAHGQYRTPKRFK